MFEDVQTTDRILTSVKEAKQLGRKVRNFEIPKWWKEGLAACIPVIKQKYSQNPSVRNSLLSTGTKIIAESTKDTLWGTGVVLSDRNALDESTWSSRGWMNVLLTCIWHELSAQLGSTADNSYE